MNNQWIPVDAKNLPDDDVNVIVTKKHTNPFGAIIYYTDMCYMEDDFWLNASTDDYAEHFDEEGRWSVEVIAWMPAPDAYIPEEENNEHID